METIRCVVERITYANEDNGFTVLKVRVKNYTDLVTVVGNMASVNAGSVLTMRGEWKNDTEHGRQFAVSAYEETLPATVHGIERYLGSGLIKGVGPQFAKRIVSMFGTDTLDVIEQNPDDLINVEGIGKKRVGMIKQAWQDQKEIKNIMLFLQDHGVSTAIAVKIFKAYGNESIETVNTLKKKPGAVRNSVALKSIPRLKAIFDTYYSRQPKKFIERFLENKELPIDELIVLFERETQNKGEIDALDVVKPISQIAVSARAFVANYAALTIGGVRP